MFEDVQWADSATAELISYLTRNLDDAILQDAKDAIVDATKMTLSYRVRNVHRSIGTKVSGEIGYQHGPEGLPEGDLAEAQWAAPVAD